MRQAGIKIWILTGDKQETAIEIGHSTNLLKRGMKLITINAHSKEACRDMIQRELVAYGLKTAEQIEQDNQRRDAGKKQRFVWLRKWLHKHLGRYASLQTASPRFCSGLDSMRTARTRRKPKPQEPVSLVIDGETLSYALREDVLEDFILLTKICHSVVCCRTSPLQKV